VEVLVRVLELDASDWKSIDDFYDALLLAVGAPAWHGRVPIALVDTMVMFQPGPNKITAPYRVEIQNSDDMPPSVKEHIVGVIDLFNRVRGYRRERGRPDADVSIVFT
jgi:hypothetical protein